MKIVIIYFFKNVVLGFHLYLKCFFNSKTSLYASKRKLGIHKHQDLNISLVRKENIRVNIIYHVLTEFSCQLYLKALSDHFISILL